jgi:hypothetical protein
VQVSAAGGLPVWRQRHQFVQALLDYVQPTAAKQFAPFGVFGRHFHQLLHLAIHVVEEEEAAVNARRGEAGVIQGFARSKVVDLTASLAGDFFRNKVFRPITILCGIQRRRKFQEKCRIEANGCNVLPHENLIPEKV